MTDSFSFSDHFHDGVLGGDERTEERAREDGNYPAHDRTQPAPRLDRNDRGGCSLDLIKLQEVNPVAKGGWGVRAKPCAG